MAELRSPLGLALSAGGALSSWQAGALLALVEAGVPSGTILGVSAGALNGTALALGMEGELRERWMRVDRSVLRFSPRLFPLSLFSDKPLAAALDFCADDAAARKRLSRKLVVVTARVDRSKRDYAVFEPGGAWDGPLHKKLMASCAIPIVFPSVPLDVDGARPRCLDGSVSCEEPFKFEALRGCRDVLVLETVRADELGRAASGFLDEIELNARRTVRSLMNQGCAGLRAGPEAPRIFRLAPSRPLDFSMLSFKSESIERGLALGKSDAAAFLARPEAALAV